MQIAFELKMTPKVLLEQVDWDELGWLLAFFKWKSEEQEKDVKRRRHRNRGRRKLMTEDE